jgi:hypothetical protein
VALPDAPAQHRARIAQPLDVHFVNPMPVYLSRAKM